MVAVWMMPVANINCFAHCKFVCAHRRAEMNAGNIKKLGSCAQVASLCMSLSYVPPWRVAKKNRPKFARMATHFSLCLQTSKIFATYTQTIFQDGKKTPELLMFLTSDSEPAGVFFFCRDPA